MTDLDHDARQLLRDAAYANEAPHARRLHARKRFVGAMSAGTLTTSAIVAKGASLGASATAATGTSLAAVAGGAVAVGFAVGLTGIALTGAVFTPKPTRSVAIAAVEPARPVVVAPTRETVLQPVPSHAPLVERAPVVAAPQRPNEASIARETELLAEAQRALKSGRPGQALAILERYAEECQGGVLHEEATASRVVALCGLGRVQDGLRWTEEFLRRYPNSHLVSRVRNACGKGAVAPASSESSRE
jgi:hypothetical protein